MSIHLQQRRAEDASRGQRKLCREQVCLGKMMKVMVDFQGFRERNILEAVLMNLQSVITPYMGVVGESHTGLTSSFLAWETGT